MIQLKSDIQTANLRFDEFRLGRTREQIMIFLRLEQTYFNDKLARRGHVFLNEVYDELYLPRTSDGAIAGWIGDTHVSFGVFEDSEVVQHILLTDREYFTLTFNISGVIYDKI